MAGNTGIKNRSEYIQRLLKEDKKLKGKDVLYGAYLQALEQLAKMTNAIYEKNEGRLDKKSHGDLVNKYLEVAELGNIYKEKGTDKTRVTVVDHMLKVISKDLKALNSMDKEKPGLIDDAFEMSRAVKVEVSENLTRRVGGQMSDRFPMKSSDGKKKGYFTARTDTAKDKQWEELFAAIEKIKLPQEQMEKLNVLKTNHELRSKLQRIPSHYKKNAAGMEGVRAEFAATLGFATGVSAAFDVLEKDKKLYTAIELLATAGLKLMMPYNLSNRLGYDPYTRNDNKNAAMYSVAKYLGCERIIAKAIPMVVVSGGRVLKGTYMEQAEGSDFSNLKSGDNLFDFDVKESAYNKNLFCDLADIQVLDYICGNVDRHKGNMLYKTEKDKDGKVKMTGIVGIDNDASFPEKDIADWEFLHHLDWKPPHIARIYRPQNFRYVTRKTAEMVNNMTRAQLETILKGHNLSKKSIDLAWERTLDVKKVINEKKYHITFADDLKEDVSRNVYKEENPFCDTPKYSNQPSIFNKFDLQMKSHAKFAEVNRKPEMARPEYKEAGREAAMLMESEKISNMNALMKRANRLKSPSREFSKMSNAMNALEEYKNRMLEKAGSNIPLGKDDYEGYEARLNELNKATKEYIQKKGIAPKTEKGRERLDASMSIENRVEDLIRNFETEKKRDEKHLEAPVMENENEKVL
jgi:hypothetical protein